MLRSRTNTATLGVKKGSPSPNSISEIRSTSPVAKKFSSLGVGEKPQRPQLEEWEVRPGGMLVQKRDPGDDATARPLPPPIRVRVKHDSVYHEIHVSPHASFGELKKLLSAQIGLHPQEQKILFKDRERNSSAFLDTSGVKDRSKMFVVEDPAGQAKRFLEMRKNASMEKAAKSLSQISLEVDRLASQVSLFGAVISEGKKVAEEDVLRLIERLMDLLIKLDGINVVGDAKLQRAMLVRRVQKHVETLDALKIKNAIPRDEDSRPQPPPPPQQQHYKQNKASESREVTANGAWETFDLLSSIPSTSSANSTTTAAAVTTTTSASSASSTHIPRYDWELF